MQFTLTIPGDLPDNMSSSVLAEAAAQGVSAALQEHFRRKNATPNAKGFPRSNYWQDAAESVSVKPNGDKAIVSVDKEGVVLHLKGGTVRPVKGKALAIPCAAAVYGVWPSHAGRELGFRPAKGAGDKKGFLVDPASGDILYALYASVTHEADPSTVPTEAELIQAGREYVAELGVIQ